MRIALTLAFLAAGPLALAPAGAATPRKAAVTTDWSKVVAPMLSGGFRMGNPKAKVELIEIGSMSCPHCKHFDAEGVAPLVANYVRPGTVSYEFRSYLLNSFDLPASLLARCNGPKSFFALTRALYKDQAIWVGKIQAAPQAQLDALQAMPQDQLPAAVAKLAGLPKWATLHGIPAPKTAKCLADSGEISRVMQASDAVTSQFPDFQGTPTFIINGQIVELTAGPRPGVWPALEQSLKAALKP